MTRISNWISIYTEAASFPSVISVPFNISRVFSEPENTLKAFPIALSKSPGYFNQNCLSQEHLSAVRFFFSLLTETEAPSHVHYSLND